MNMPSYLWSFLALALAFATQLPAADIFTGSGIKIGEITDRTAIVLVRLTKTDKQDEQGLIPGAAGEARLRYYPSDRSAANIDTGWKTVDPKSDWSIKFHLTDLKPGTRYNCFVHFRETTSTTFKVSLWYSFVTAPPPDQRATVKFHVTTCQDLKGFWTYRHMYDQKPDFCVSAGDNVYYDGQCLARNVPQAYEAYQKMFGLPLMRDYFGHVGTYFMKDDHDFRFNDSDPHMPGRWVNVRQNDPLARYTETKGNLKLDVNWMTAEEGIRVFKTVFPLREKTYRTVRWGKGLQIWMTENRDYRSPNDMPDGPDKSIWGAEQKAWLKQSLLASDADFRIIVSPNSVIGPDRIMKGDNQANINGFWYEGQMFLDWLKDNKLNNVVLMNGDRHWQYHSIDKRSGRHIHEFGCGPTCDEHIQPVPPDYDGVDRPYSASRGGFLTVTYNPDRTLSCEYFSVDGQPLNRTEFR